MALLNIVMTVQDTDPAQNRESRDLPQQDEVLQEESIGDQNSQTNYPDLVPRTETRFEAERKLSLRENFVKSQVHQIEQSATAELHTASQLTDFGFTDYRVSEQFEIENQEVQSGPISETLFLLAILFGTCILLYFFPPGP